MVMNIMLPANEQMAARLCHSLVLYNFMAAVT